MQNLHCKGDWFDLVCKSYLAPEQNKNKLNLPGFPDEAVQIRTTGQAGRETLCEAFIFYEDCIKHFKKTKNFKNNNKVVMDFGVGWGRILRFFLKDFAPQNMIGVDINPDLLEICRSTQSQAMPPVKIKDQSVDYIVGYSVFSHLSEAACLEWVREFARILKPGGMVALTTRGRWFLDYCKNLKAKSGYPHALSQMFEDFEDAKQRYDRGEFLHSNSFGITGAGVLDSSFYGETFIPEKYVKRIYSQYFKMKKYEFTPGRSSHPIMFLMK